MMFHDRIQFGFWYEYRLGFQCRFGFEYPQYSVSNIDSVFRNDSVSVLIRFFGIDSVFRIGSVFCIDSTFVIVSISRIDSFFHISSTFGIEFNLAAPIVLTTIATITIGVFEMLLTDFREESIVPPLFLAQVTALL